MKNITLALALLLATSSVLASEKLTTSFDVDYKATAVVKDNASHASSDNRYIDQLLRTSIHFKDESGVLINTRLNISDQEWAGDRRASNAPGSNSSDGADNLSLDYGYIHIPLAGGLLRVGRQIANWGYGLTASDDRRDRILYSRGFLGNKLFMFAIFDKRQEGAYNIGDDDGDMYSIAGVYIEKKWQVGILVAKWKANAKHVDSGTTNEKNGYSLDDTLGIAPYGEVTVGKLQFKSAINYLNGNGRGDGKYTTGAGLWANNSWAGFIRGTLNLTSHKIKLEAQALFVKDGGLVEPGQDSFANIIQNNPRNNPNPSSLTGIGGFGYDGDDQSLYAIRVSGNIVKTFRISLAGGLIDTKNNNPLPENQIATIQFDNYYNLDEIFYETQATFELTKKVELKGSYGKIGGKKDGVTGAGLEAMSLTLTYNY